MQDQQNSSLMQQLRTATRVHHDQIELNPRMHRLTQPDLTLSEYAQILHLMKIFYADLEQQLGVIEPLLDEHGFDLTDRYKLPLLHQDLEAIGQTTQHNVTVNGNADKPVVPAITNLSDVTGCLYVIEGSTLGGQIIGKHLKKNLALSTEHGAAFFNGYGTQTGAMWKSFKSFVTHSDQQGLLHHDQAVHMAQSMFTSLDQWMATDLSFHTS